MIAGRRPLERQQPACDSILPSSPPPTSIFRDKSGPQARMTGLPTHSAVFCVSPRPPFSKIFLKNSPLGLSRFFFKVQSQETSIFYFPCFHSFHRGDKTTCALTETPRRYQIGRASCRER